MKKISLVCLSLCAVQFAQAGPSFSLLKKKDAKHYRFIQALAAGATGATAAKTTTLKERVVAQNYIGQGEVDSTIFTYNSGNGNGSQFDYNAVQYAVQFSYQDVFLEGVSGNHARPYVFADVVQDYNNQNGPIALAEVKTVSYDANNNISVFDDSDLQNGDVTYVANYTQQNINNATGIYDFSGVSDTGTLRFFRYNQSGHIAADSTYENLSFGTPGSLVLSQRNDYTYDNAGNLTLLLSSDYDANTMAIIPDTRYVNTYTADNRLKTSVNQSYNGSGWDTNYTDSFGYTANIPFYTYWLETDPGSSIPSILNYHTTVAGTVDSIYGSGDTGSGNLSNIRLLLAFDTYNNPVTANLYYGLGSSFPTTPAEHFSYYYETYTPSAVSNVVNAASNVHVYPNPAHNELYVSGLTGTGNLVSVVNMTGQVVMTQTTGNNTVQAVPLNGLASGNYVLHITDANGNRVHTQTIVKQ